MAVAARNPDPVGHEQRACLVHEGQVSGRFVQGPVDDVGIVLERLGEDLVPGGDDENLVVTVVFP